MKLDKRTVLYDTMLLTFSSIALQLLGFVYRITVSRIAGADGMGVYQLVLSAYSIMSAFALSGFTMAVSRLSADRNALNDACGLRLLVRLSMGMFGLSFAVTAFVVASCSGFIAGNILGDPRTQIALLLFLPALFFTGLENILKSYFYGVKKVFAPITSELIEQSVRIAFAIGFLLIFRPKTGGGTAAAIVAGTVVSEVFSSSTLGLFYRRHKADLHGRCLERGQAIKMAGRIFTIAAPLALSGVLNNLIGSANTILIPQRLVASGISFDVAMQQFGILFAMTMPLLSLPSAFIQPLNMVLVPKLAAAMALGNNQDIRRKTGKAIQVTGLFVAPVMAVLIPLGRPLSILLYDNAAAADYMTPLAIATLFTFYQIVTGCILNGVGQQKRAAGSVVAVGLIQLAFTALLVGDPAYRMDGYVIGDLISAVIGATINFVWVARYTGVHYRVKNWFGIPLLSATVSGLAAKLSYDILLTCAPQTTALFGSLGISAVVYLLALRFQGLNFLRYLRTLKRSI